MLDVVVEDVPYATPDGEPLPARVHAPRDGGPWRALVDAFIARRTAPASSR